MGLVTTFDFTLPKGYVDRDGQLHRHGTMRLATARDEIEPLRDPRISGPEDPYLTILVLARVITDLGTMSQISVRDVEGLFAADLAFLQDLYGIINFGNPADVAELQAAVLPTEELIDDDSDGWWDDDTDHPLDSADGADLTEIMSSGGIDDDSSEDDSSADVNDDDALVIAGPRHRGRIEEVVAGSSR